MDFHSVHGNGCARAKVASISHERRESPDEHYANWAGVGKEWFQFDATVEKARRGTGQDFTPTQCGGGYGWDSALRDGHLRLRQMAPWGHGSQRNWVDSRLMPPWFGVRHRRQDKIGHNHTSAMCEPRGPARSALGSD